MHTTLKVTFAGVMALCLAGCTTARLTEPGQTATQQLLVSTAIDHAVAQMNPNVPPGTKVFVDPQFYDVGDSGPYTKYAVASIRDHLLQQGLRLTDDKGRADMVVELRTGAQSIDHNNYLIGLPAIPFPIPFAGTVLTPKVAIYESDRQTGVAKIALTAYDKDGKLATSTGPIYGMSKMNKWVVMLLISGTKSDLIPKDVKK